MPGENTSSTNPGTSQKKKRPMGLKARAAKKHKTSNDQPTEDGAQEVNDFGDSNTATIMLKNDGNEASEIDELEGIFDGALEALSADDPERALTLLRGTIHECDRILRVHDEQGQVALLEAKFFYIYGMALFSISEIAEPDDKHEYLVLARDRLVQAEELMNEDLGWKVLEGLAKVRLELAATATDVIDNDDAEQKEKGDRLINDAVGSLDKALSVLPKDLPEQLVAESLGIFDLVLSLVDSRRLSESASFSLLTWAEDTSSKLPDALSNTDVRTAQGRCKWIFSSILLEQQDEETGEVPRREELVESLGAALVLLKGIETNDALLLHGEAALNLGNIVDGEKRQEELYAEAVDCFKLVQDKGELPEQFAQFLEDFENEDDDDDDDDGDDDNDDGDQDGDQDGNQEL
ncbi:hypothetical protein J3B02_000166 [Coemansia erecta]|nr:hypothetical protein J3B02_000166 [Coemansia erecta]KAJ2889243.1 hypothetical protein FB639_000020 [Coemansia asiatica]